MPARIKAVSPSQLAGPGAPATTTSPSTRAQPARNGKVSAADCYFKSDADVRFDAASKRWLMKLPNTTLTFDRKPVWLDALDEKNAILEASAEPARLRQLHDELCEIAKASYDCVEARLDLAPIAAHLATEPDAALLKGLLGLFEIALRDETKSTFQYGGAMAGVRCSEMHKLTGIVKVIKDRLAAVG